MKLYQLVARGRRFRLESSGKIYSRQVFRTGLEAVAYKEEFKRIVTTPKNDYDLMVLDSDDSHLEIFIVELELQETA